MREGAGGEGLGWAGKRCVWTRVGGSNRVWGRKRGGRGTLERGVGVHGVGLLEE